MRSRLMWKILSIKLVYPKREHAAESSHMKELILDIQGISIQSIKIMTSSSPNVGSYSVHLRLKY